MDFIGALDAMTADEMTDDDDDAIIGLSDDDVASTV
jgi:hypothetical protein